MSDFNTVSEIVVFDAIKGIKKADPVYWTATLLQRCDGGSGSYYPGIVGSRVLEDMLRRANWAHYEHPFIANGCMGFKAPIPGVLGVVDLEGLDENLQVTLADMKNTRMLTAEIPRASIDTTVTNVDFTVLIVGVENTELVVRTFHPGDPVVPSALGRTPELFQKRITVKEALDLGLKFAKLV